MEGKDIKIKYTADIDDVQAKLKEVILLLEKIKELYASLGIKIDGTQEYISDTP